MYMYISVVSVGSTTYDSRMLCSDFYCVLVFSFLPLLSVGFDSSNHVLVGTVWDSWSLVSDVQLLCLIAHLNGMCASVMSDYKAVILLVLYISPIGKLYIQPDPLVFCCKRV